jgi:hypothetical protein
MLRIFNTKVYGLDESIIASGYPMKEEVGEMFSTTEEKDCGRAKKLGKAKSGSGHDCFLKGVTVQADVRFPLYWLKQFQRYHFADIVSSQSTMHQILNMDIENHCNEWVDDDMINNVKFWILQYKNFDRKLQNLKDKVNNSGGVLFEEAFNMYPENKLYIDEKWCSKKDIYMKIISNLPSGFEMVMRITTNYLQLKTIYQQRKNHKLPDWHVFCSWILGLPKFKELVLGDI